MTLDVIKPGITSFDIGLDYPSYTGRHDEELHNIGDLVVPEGTQLTWDIQAAHTESLDAQFEGNITKIESERRSEDRFILKSKAGKDSRYTIFLNNSLLPHPDSVQYNIRVIPDRFPGIRVESFADSVEHNLIYFAGNADDDYGIRSLTFQYEIVAANGKIKTTQTEGMDVLIQHSFLTPTVLISTPFNSNPVNRFNITLKCMTMMPFTEVKSAVPRSCNIANRRLKSSIKRK
jgi:hypothetical protein